jgi:hypothetical protein
MDDPPPRKKDKANLAAKKARLMAKSKPFTFADGLVMDANFFDDPPPARKKKAPRKTLKTNTLKQAVDSYIKFTKIKASKTSFLEQVDAFSGKQADSFRMYLRQRKPTENMPARFQRYMDQFERKAKKVKNTKTARKRKQVLSKPSALRSGRSYT